MTSKGKLISFLIVFVVATILLSALPNWFTIGATERGDKEKGPVGTWWTFPGSDLLTFHADGTLTASSALTKSYGVVYSISSAHGTWTRTGSRSIQSVHLMKLQSLDHTQCRIWRVRATNEFDEDFDQGIGGYVYIDEYACASPYSCPNPVTDEPTTPNLFQFPGSGLYRVTVE